MDAAKPFIHAQALCESDRIGNGTRLWAFAHVLPGAVLGADCNICDHVFIENDVVVGDRVTIKCGVQLWDGVRLEDDVFVGPNATFTNDVHPRSKEYPEAFPQTLVRKGASLGANCTLLPGVTIGEGAMVGAGAVVTHDVPAGMVVTGVPARVTGPVRDAGEVRAPKVTHLVELKTHRDERGTLTVGEFQRDVPFTPLRYFVVEGDHAGAVRGRHAHMECHQYLTCLAGRCTVVVDTGHRQETIELQGPSRGVHLPPLTWSEQTYHDPGTILLVMASHYYDPQDYVHDYDEFRRLTGGSSAS